MSILIPNIKFIKDGNENATNLLIKILLYSNLAIISSALLFTFLK